MNPIPPQCSVDTPLATGLSPARHFGDDILRALRYKSGGITYMKGSDFQHIYYVDKVPYCIFNLIPPSLVPSNATEPLFTEIGQGWVRLEALNLLGYPYHETPSGQICFQRNLAFVSGSSPLLTVCMLNQACAKAEIEDLVKLSYQAVGRVLEERSRRLVEKYGLYEKDAALNQNLPTSHPQGSPWPPEVRSALPPPGFSRDLGATPAVPSTLPPRESLRYPAATPAVPSKDCSTQYRLHELQHSKENLKPGEEQAEIDAEEDKDKTKTCENPSFAIPNLNPNRESGRATGAASEERWRSVTRRT